MLSVTIIFTFLIIIILIKWCWRYDTVYLTCSKKLTGSIPHGTNEKYWRKNYKYDKDDKTLLMLTGTLLMPYRHPSSARRPPAITTTTVTTALRLPLPPLATRKMTSPARSWRGTLALSLFLSLSLSHSLRGWIYACFTEQRPNTSKATAQMYLTLLFLVPVPKVVTTISESLNK